MAKVFKKVFSMILAFSLTMGLMNIVAFAEGGNACKIGETEYETFEKAYAAAENGDTIILLKDTEIETDKYVDKSLTIKGNGYTLEALNCYISLQSGKDSDSWNKLTFDNCTFNFTADKNTNKGWLMFCFGKNTALNLVNGAEFNVEFDSSGVTRCAFYGGEQGPCEINLSGKSSLNITGKNTKGISGQGIQNAGGANGMAIKIIEDSSLTIDGTNRGYVDSPTITVKDSALTVQNCTSNGSNGGKATFINSIINYNDNAAHGLSAGELTIDNSTVNANGNGANGVTAGNELKVINNSKLTISKNVCSISSKWTQAGALLVKGKNSIIDKTCTVSITENNGSGIYVKNGADLTMETGAVTNNLAKLLGYGGGIYVDENARFTMSDGVRIYNNHAGKGGDDIYSNPNASTTIVPTSKMGDKLVLDDCEHDITGWFLDDEDARWNVVTLDGKSCVEGHESSFIEYTPAEPITEKLALKAAHGTISYTLNVRYVDEDGNDVAASESLALESGAEYKTSAAEAEGYSFDHMNESSDAAEGVMDGNKTVVYVYKAVLEEIPEEDIPLDDGKKDEPSEDLTEIPEEKVPMTGDAGSMMYVISGLCSAAFIAKNAIGRKKKNR